MAKQTLADTVDESEIVDLGEVENEPNILIDDDFGITGKYLDYALVQRKVAHKTGKEEDGINNGKVIRYTKWEDCKYSGDIFGCLRMYQKISNLNKISKLKSCKDFKVIEDIFKSTDDTINKFFKGYGDMSNQQQEMAGLIDMVNLLKLRIKESNKVFDAVQELHELVKAKRKIVINDTEPKKVRYKQAKEEEEEE